VFSIRHITPIPLLIITLLISNIFTIVAVSAQEKSKSETTKKLIECNAILDDRAGVLTNDDISLVESMADSLRRNVNIAVFTIIVKDFPDNPEITFSDDFSKKADEMGFGSDRFLVLVISTEPARIAYKKSPFIEKNLSPDDLAQLENNLVSLIRDGEYALGVNNFISGLPDSPSLKPVVETDIEAAKEAAGKTPWLEFKTRFDDRTGVLTGAELAEIISAAEKQERELGIKAYLLMVPQISEWNLGEYVRDVFKYWKSQGRIDEKSYLIVISVDNYNLQVVRGDYINNLDDDYEVSILMNDLYKFLKEKKYSEGIINFIENIGAMPALSKAINEEKKRKEKSQWFVLVGLLIIILVFMRMSYRRKLAEHQRQESELRRGPFIE
jgi:uncharacterized membrane protein YgcG